MNYYNGKEDVKAIDLIPGVFTRMTRCVNRISDQVANRGIYEIYLKEEKGYTKLVWRVAATIRELGVRYQYNRIGITLLSERKTIWMKEHPTNTRVRG